MTSSPTNAPSKPPVAPVSLDGASDGVLIAAVQSGDSAAFETMARRYGPALCTYVYRYVRSRETAEELVQDVFLSILQQGSQWVVRDTLPTYLYGAVRNRAFNFLRHAAVEQHWSHEISAEHASDDRPANLGDDIVRHVESGDLATAVQAAIRELSPRQRLVIALRWYHQLSYAEIAAVTHTSPRSVETSLGRALKALRQRLASVFP